MRTLTLQEVAAAMGARIHGEVRVPTVTGVATDSRKPVEGCLFFAIAGQQFDGHAFVDGALERGAVAAVVSEPSKVSPRFRGCGRLLQVANVVEAMGKLAAWYRRQMAAQVIAVVGSNGKTTTKDLIAAVLASKKPGKAAPSSFNNAVGVPLTLLSVEPQDEFVVVEIGTNKPGEGAVLGRSVQPDLAVVTSIGEEHLEFFGDVDGVAREEFSLLACFRNRGFIALSDQAAKHAPVRSLQECAVLTYGLSEEADLRAVRLSVENEGQRFRVNDRFDYWIPLLGTHNLVNAMGAIAIGNRLRLDHEEIAHALRQVRPSPMRGERLRIGDMTVINDAYNANPSSMRAALEVMDQLSGVGRKVLILGDMRELGTEALRCHQAVGRDAGRSTANVVIAGGAYARIVADGVVATAGATKRIYSFATLESLSEKLGGLIEPGDAILLKASRGVRLEQLLEPLMEIGRSSTVK